MIDSEQMSEALVSKGFYCITNFLAAEYYESLVDIAQKMHRSGLFRRAKVGATNQAQQHDSIRSDEIYWLNEDSNEEAIHVYLKQINIIVQALNRSLFLGLNEFESHFATYVTGTFYKKHVDQFSTKKTRKISCVYYLNSHWRDEDGGELKLYNTQDKLIHRLLPKGNHFICFNSELPHEVCLTHRTRYSIAGWMKSSS